MMKRARIISLLTALLIGYVMPAQEVITGLNVNRQLQQQNSPDHSTRGQLQNQAGYHRGSGKLRPPGTLTTLKNMSDDNYLTLPFSDDFSDGEPLPSPERWADAEVFINNTFSIRQLSAGIATFDCLDEKGMLYPHASKEVFEADHLTSLPIDLEYPASDSIFLSFLYEAGGVADMPEANDSLTLRFWDPDEERWYSIWRAYGETTNGFRRVMIPVTESRYLKKGFRFMFTSHASLSGAASSPSRTGNADQWNIDHVLLDRNRSLLDTVIRDVALTLPLRSLLKEYEAMPWHHFRHSYLSSMSPSATIIYRNNDTIVRNVTRHVTITDLVTNSVVRNFDAGAANADPMSDVRYDATLLYTYNSNPSADTALFRVTVSLITDEFDPKQNDTLTYIQRFADYFAIDDGTAEAGYGIDAQGSRNAMAALRFRAFTPDSVTGISISFNDSYQGTNRRAFDLMIWADDNGRPGELMGSSDTPLAEPGDELNGLVSYYFDQPVRVSDYFWIGWRQKSETFLNVGFDINTAPLGRQYYHFSGEWHESQQNGVIMIRPLMGSGGTPTSLPAELPANNLFTIWPNPTRGLVTLRPSDEAPDDFIIDVISTSGSLVLSLVKHEMIDLSSLSSGAYILVIKSREGRPLSLLRIIKTN